MCLGFTTSRNHPWISDGFRLRCATTDKTRSLATLCYQFHAAIKHEYATEGYLGSHLCRTTHTRQHTRTRMCTRIPQKVHTHTHKKDALTHTLSMAACLPHKIHSGMHAPAPTSTYLHDNMAHVASSIHLHTLQYMTQHIYTTPSMHISTAHWRVLLIPALLHLM